LLWKRQVFLISLHSYEQTTDLPSRPRAYPFHHLQLLPALADVALGSRIAKLSESTRLLTE
jgi:hypothetical protein